MAEPKRLEVSLITGRTIEQGEAIEGHKMAQGYVEAAGVVYLDPEDMKELGVWEGDVIRVETDFGSVLVAARKSPDAPHRGVAFIPMGPWANAVVNPSTDSIGMPSFKGVRAVVSPAPGEEVSDAKSLLAKLRGG